MNKGKGRLNVLVVGHNHFTCQMMLYGGVIVDSLRVLAFGYILDAGIFKSS